LIERLADRFTRALERIVAYALVLAVLVNFANVVARYVFHRPIVGADELQVFLMVWMSFLGVVVVTWRRMHLRMDLVAARLPAPARGWLRLAEALLTAALAALVLGESCRYAARMFEIGRRSDALGIPGWIPHSSVAIAFGLIGLIAVYRLTRRAAQGPRA
jgi:TRAP-type C4-dicarboxylate transport system permease small subunit